MKEYILEACVDSVESAMAAVEGGADRLELCGNLIIGGTTPGPWLFDEIRKRSDIRIHALIRPRFGDFCYTDAEFSMIKHAVEDFRKMGAEGVVFGVLKPDGTLNMEQMKALIAYLESVRQEFVATKDKSAWYDLIQLLPSSYNQMRTCTFNYENLIAMYYARRNHKLEEWHTFCRWVETLPYAKDLILIKE